MRFRHEGRGKETIIFNFRNTEPSLTIQQGSPIFLSMDGTSDGFHCVSAENLGESRLCFFFGMAMQPVLPGSFGESQVFGFIENMRFMVNSRAASTDAWSALPQVNTGDLLDFVTTPGAQCVSRLSSCLYALDGQLFAAQSFAAQASSASNATDTRILITTPLKGYITFLKIF